MEVKGWKIESECYGNVRITSPLGNVSNVLTGQTHMTSQVMNLLFKLAEVEPCPYHSNAVAGNCTSCAMDDLMANQV